VAGKTNGLITLMYHFFRRNLGGKAQFDHFRNSTAEYQHWGGKKIILIDYETTENVSNAIGNQNFRDLCTAARADGFLTGLYISPGRWNEYELGSWVNNHVDIYWLAHWKSGNDPLIPAGMDAAKVAIHQEGIWDSNAWIEPIPGAKPRLDCNLLIWPLSQFEDFTGQKYKNDQDETEYVLVEINTRVTNTHRVIKSTPLYEGASGNAWNIYLTAVRPVEKTKSESNGRARVFLLHSRAGIRTGWIPLECLEKLKTPVKQEAVYL
jgi:hypothetical protein